MIANSILWHNQDGYGTGPSAQIMYFSPPVVTYSAVQGGWSGTGNISADPQFVGPIDPVNAPTTAGDFRLLPTSPAIDAGDNSAVPVDLLDLDNDGNINEPLPYDLDGRARFFDHSQPDSGSGQPPLVDMGVYEAFPSVSLVFSPTSPFGVDPVTFEVTFEAPMDLTVAPSVTFGQTAPFTTDTVIPRVGAGFTNGFLDSDPTKWYGDFTFVESMPNGSYGVSVAGAVTAEGASVPSDVPEYFVLDTGHPTGSVGINNLASVTVSTDVMLIVTGQDDVTSVSQYSASNDGVSYSDWVAFDSPYPWTLNPGDGAKSVYLRLQDEAGNISQVISDSIVLDTAIPGGTNMVEIDGGAALVSTPRVILTAKGAAHTAQVRYADTAGGLAAADWEPYDATRAMDTELPGTRPGRGFCRIHDR